MIKYLLVIFCFSIPLYAVIDKFSALKKAESHKQSAIKYLQDADKMCWYIPDAEHREHMHALISSTIAATFISDPKTKLLAIGLPLAGSLVSNAFDKYRSYQEMLAKSSYHMEMAGFYSVVSINLPNSIKDKNAKYFFKALDYLTLCDMIIWMMDGNKWEWNKYSNEKFLSKNKKVELSNYFVKEREYMADSYLNYSKNHNGHINKKL